MSKVYKSVPPNYIYTWSTRIWLAESRMSSSMQHKHLLLLTMHCSLYDQTLFHVIPLFHQIIWQSYQQQEWEAEVKVCSNCEIIHLNKWTAPPCSFFCFLTRGIQLEDSHSLKLSSHFSCDPKARALLSFGLMKWGSKLILSMQSWRRHCLSP